MSVTYQTTILGFGNHAAIEIPDEVLAELGANRRAPLRITIGTHSYQSTATGMDGRCLVVFPKKERDASGVAAGDVVDVTLELDAGRREVEVPEALAVELATSGLTEVFEALSYSKRKEFARQVAEAKAEETRARRVDKVIAALKG